MRWTATWRVGLLGLCALAGASSDTTGNAAVTAPVATRPDIRGSWQNSGSIFRMAIDGAKVTAVFEIVSPEAQVLGFKEGDVSFAGTRSGNFIQGEQVIRYAAEVACHREGGRRVPFMAMVADDGRRIVIDWYSIALDIKTCRDLGRTVGVTELERPAE